ncbi:MAG: FAD-dependent oxidoreductase, partial [Bacteroidota bacterium]
PDEVKRNKYGTRNANHGTIYNDDRKLKVVSNEPRIKLFLEERVVEVIRQGTTIQGVIAQSTRTSRQTLINGRFFADCTGDATVGFLAGADYEISSSGFMGSSNMWSVMDAHNEAEVLKCECKDKAALTLSCEVGNYEQPFPRCPWAIDLTDKPFPGRANYKAQWGSEDPLGNLGGWFWESGFDKNPITDVEKIRDLNFRAMYGAWDALKNVDKLYPNHRLGWSAFISGKRESRRLMGDVKLTADDFRDEVNFPDGAFPCSWGIDVHSPHKDYDQELTGQEFISYATTGKGYDYEGPYWAPYRVLYSRNLANLFMAGRNISVSREGLGPVRVMKTCGMMGEIVGKAAAICVQEQTTPRGVYQEHLDKLKTMMQEPGAKRV